MSKRTPEEIDAIFENYFNRQKRKKIKTKRSGTRRGPIGIPLNEWRNINYRRWVSSQACCIAGCTSRWTQPYFMQRIDPAHTERGGKSQKGPDKSCGPLCRYMHDQYDAKSKLPNGEVGEKAFEAYYEVDMKAMAAKYWEEWNALQKKRR